MRTFYPTSVMETGYDILFFWVARMMMMGCYLTGTEPFHTVYLHGLVRDEHGRKMSKTANNVVNPLEIMDQYGTDALRFTLTTSGSPGQDLNLNPQRIEASRNFANKVWNITRFVVGAPERAGVSIASIAQLAGDAPPPPHPFPPRSQALAHHPAATRADRWVLSRYGKLVTEVDRLLEGYNFGEAGRQIEDFLWSEFADWYVEAAKVQLEATEPQRTLTCGVLFTVLEGSLRLLHPFMPFLTETAWQLLRQAAPAAGAVPRREVQHDEPMTTPPPQADPSVPSRSSIMKAVYPTVDSVIRDEAAERLFGLLQELITGIRNVRNEYKVEATRWIAATMIAGPHTAMLQEQAALISTLARVDAEHLTIVSERNETVAADLAQQSATLVVGSVEVLLPLAGLIDLKVEHTRLQKELQEAEAEVSRREARLANADFVNKAPPAVVQRERDNLVTVQATVERLRERLANLLTMMKDA
jgi:valyl-tRNA synthetase